MSKLRRYLTRCSLCHGSAQKTLFTVQQFSVMWGWHKTIVLCGTCGYRLFDLVHKELASEVLMPHESPLT